MKEKSPAPITDAEWVVMELLWVSSPQTTQDLAKALALSRDWKRTTVLTLLQRLARKGVIAAEPEGARFQYRPLVQREDCVAAETESFLQRLFGGALHPLVAHFAKRHRLTRKDREELEALLEQLKSKK